MTEPTGRPDLPGTPRRPRSQARRRLLEGSGYFAAEELSEAPALDQAPETRWPRKKVLLLIGVIVAVLALLFWGALTLANYVQVQNALRLERLRLEELAREKARHPYEYRGLVEDYASEQGLDPALVAAMILNESSFNPKAESRVGARGLMQLMPSTAEWVAGKLKEPYDFDMMYDPETNIRFGCWFLGYLSRKFDGDFVKMVAGYHAGGGAVDEWMDNPAYAQDGVLTTIPIAETDRYVQKVLTAYDIYIKHYYTAEDESTGEGTGGA